MAENWDHRKSKWVYQSNLESLPHRLPMQQLPEQYRPSPTNLEPKLLHYGFPIHLFDAYDLAKANNMEIPANEKDGVPFELVRKVARELSKEVGHTLDVEYPFEATTDFDVILRFYSNYSEPWEKPQPDKEEDMVETLRELFRFSKGFRPLWFFDVEEPDYDDQENEDQEDDDDE